MKPTVPPGTVEVRPVLEVRIATGVTTLDESGVRYRDHDVAELSRACSYEQVCELLWTGAIGTEPHWAAPAADDAATAAALTAALGGPGCAALMAVSCPLGTRYPRCAPPAAARRVLASAPPALC